MSMSKFLHEADWRIYVRKFVAGDCTKCIRNKKMMVIFFSKRLQRKEQEKGKQVVQVKVMWSTTRTCINAS